MQAELKVVGGKQDNQVVPLPQGKFLIGREQDCHLRPNSELVSRHHAVVTSDEFGIRVRDLGSTNGTFVNGERIEKQVELKAGDKLVVGSLNFELVVHQAAPVPVAAGGDGAAVAPPPVDPAPAAVPAAPTDADAGTETIMNMPAIPPSIEDTQNMSSGDTTMIPAQPQPQPQHPPQQPGAPAYPPQPQFSPPPMQYPPGYGQFQPQPQMYPPQYPQMPYPQQMPGYPMPPQPMPMPQQPPPAAAPPAPAGSDIPEVSLPKPGETGLKEEQDAKGSGGAGSSDEANPSNSAGDIIKQYIQRRPE